MPQAIHEICFKQLRINFQDDVNQHGEEVVSAGGPLPFARVQ